jgi:hypothetical protein
MSWHFSRALVEASSAGTCSDGEQSAPSSSTSTRETFSLRVRTMDSCRRSRSGMTSAPLTAAHGEAVLTWCLGDSLARTSAPRAREPGSKANAPASGPKWPGSFVMYDHDSSSWKTAQCSLLAGLDVYSETWPRWGSMRSGACWERSTSAPRIDATASGSLPTLTKNGLDGGAGSRAHPGYRRGPTSLILAEWMMGWPAGWTDCQPLETARFHEWQRQHSSS